MRPLFCLAALFVASTAAAESLLATYTTERQGYINGNMILVQGNEGGTVRFHDGSNRRDDIDLTLAISTTLNVYIGGNIFFGVDPDVPLSLVDFHKSNAMEYEWLYANDVESDSGYQYTNFGFQLRLYAPDHAPEPSTLITALLAACCLPTRPRRQR